MPVSTFGKTKNKLTENVVSALTARTQLGQILKRASERDERFVVDRRGKPSVIIMSVRDYVRNIAPTPPALHAIQEDAERNGTSKLSMAEIDREIAAVRRQQASKTKPKQPKR
jgi:prevent-host-death family protein